MPRRRPRSGPCRSRSESPGRMPPGRRRDSAALRRSVSWSAPRGDPASPRGPCRTYAACTAATVVVTVGLPGRCGKCRGTLPRRAAGLAGPRRALGQRGLELLRPRGDLGAEILGLEHLGEAAVGEDLADEPVGAADADLLEGVARRQRERAALDAPARDLLVEEDPGRRGRRAACAARGRGAARSVCVWSVGRGACGRGGSCAARRACGPTSGRTTRAARARARAARSARTLGLLADREVLDLDEPLLADRLRRACGRAAPPRVAALVLGAPRAWRTRRRSPRASGGRARAASAPRRRSSARRTRARGGSPAPRAASGAAARRKASPKSSLSTRTSSPSSAA